jgi:hypothetical protein
MRHLDLPGTGGPADGDDGGIEQWLDPRVLRHRTRLTSPGDHSRATATRPGFFKTGPGAYGEGDVFAGIAVPAVRRAVRAHRELPLGEIELLLGDDIHEHRLAAVLLLADRYGRAAKAGDRTAGQATGWMLREVGKRVSRDDLIAFLDEDAAAMPRTMLRYAVEHLDTDLRAHYLAARAVNAGG